MKENKITFLDGSSEQQNKAVEEFLASLTQEEHERAMSKEFDYLED